MRISEERRHEVAKRMREYDVAEFKESAIVPFLECLGHGYMIWRVILDELADLIDRPTCTMTYKPEWSDDEIYPTSAYQCSNCGSVVNEGITEYCPSCGCRVSNFETES